MRTFKIASIGSVLVLIAAISLFSINSKSREDNVRSPRTSSQEPGGTKKQNGEDRSTSDFVSVILASEEKVPGKDLDQLGNSYLSPEQARAILSKVDITNIDERMRLSGSVLRALCKSGFSEDAWKLVDSNVGTVRQAQLGTMFAYSKEPLTALLARFRQLVEPGERVVAINGIAANGFDMVNFDYTELPLETERDKNALGQALSMRISGSSGYGSSDPGNSRLLLEKSATLVKDGVLGPNQLGLILANDHTVDVYEKWTLLEGLQGTLKPNEMEAVQSKLVSQMIESDMSKALLLITTDQSTKYSVPVLTRAIKAAYSVDPTQVNEWVVRNLATIDPATGQRLIFGVGQVAIANNELQTAQKWADRLVNPSVKQQLIDQIEAAKLQPPK